MANCGQACPYNTLAGCKVKENKAICPLTNMAVPITEYRITNADRIRAMSDEALAQYLYALANKDFELDYCQNKPECLALVDTDEGVPEEHCRACLLEYLQKPEEMNNG